MNDMESILITIALAVFIYLVVRRVKIKDQENFENRDN